MYFGPSVWSMIDDREKITSRWLRHRHANCFQLIATHGSIFIKWITAGLLVYRPEAADQFHRERAGRRADAGRRASKPQSDQKMKCVHNRVFVLPHCAAVHIFPN